MRSALRRSTAFSDRGQPSLIDPSLVAVNVQQMANHAEHVAVIYPKQMLLRDVLNTRGLTGPAAFQYEAFSAEMYANSRRFAGPAAVLAAGVLFDKFLALGLGADSLADIAQAVWGLDIPPAGAKLDTPADLAPAEPVAGNLVWFAAARATGYDVYLHKTVDPPALVSADQPGLVYAYAGLANLTQYSWYVIARNHAGFGPSSAVRTFTTI